MHHVRCGLALGFLAWPGPLGICRGVGVFWVCPLKGVALASDEAVALLVPTCLHPCYVAT